MQNVLSNTYFHLQGIYFLMCMPSQVCLIFIFKEFLLVWRQTIFAASDPTGLLMDYLGKFSAKSLAPSTSCFYLVKFPVLRSRVLLWKDGILWLSLSNIASNLKEEEFMGIL